MKTHPPKTAKKSAPRACIWMQAGVVRRKYCRADYQCAACRYDAVLHRLAEENRAREKSGSARPGKGARIVFWKEKLRERPAPKRPCLHHMKGRIEYRSCARDYSCSDCEFDQFFFDQFAVHAAVRPIAMIDVDGIKIPQGYYLHHGHTWVKIEEENTVRVGLDELVLRAIGALDRIDAPLIGKTVRQDVPGMSLERGGRTAAALSPVSGVVTATNPKFLAGGCPNSRQAYSDDWIMRIHADNLRGELKHLMIHAETTEFVQEETRRLFGLIEETAGPLAADGGQLAEDLYGSMPQVGWRKIVGLLLKT